MFVVSHFGLECIGAFFASVSKHFYVWSCWGGLGSINFVENPTVAFYKKNGKTSLKILLQLCIMELEKRRYSAEDNHKYYIDCNNFSKDPSSIQTTELFKKSGTAVVIHAIATDDTIRKKNRHIVVKINRMRAGKMTMAEKEYLIGTLLHDLPGFIQFICLFPCYDKTLDGKLLTKENEPPRPYSKPICEGGVLTNVLVMPFVRDGSLLRHTWTNNTIELLKSLIIHTIFSIANAFVQVGFLHHDLHWDNVLFKRTKQATIKYTMISDKEVPTNGYKIVIMDFEKSETKHTDISRFWQEIDFFIGKYNTLPDNGNERLTWTNSHIKTKLDDYTKRKSPIENIGNIITEIYESDMRFNPIQIFYDTYDPNVI
jgi:hypothetical protein